MIFFVFSFELPACRRLLFSLLHAEKGRSTKEIGDVCTQASFEMWVCISFAVIGVSRMSSWRGGGRDGWGSLFILGLARDSWLSYKSFWKCCIHSYAAISHLFTVVSFSRNLFTIPQKTLLLPEFELSISFKGWFTYSLCALFLF